MARNYGKFPARWRDRGLSLAELLVATVIGLFATIAIVQVFAVFEGQKRTTMSGGDAQINGALALFTVERDLRQAGYGINNTDFLGCNIVGWDEQAGVPTPAMAFAPVVITQGAGGASDTITIMYGSGDLLPAPANLTQNMPSPSAVYKVNNRYGFLPGNLVIAAEAGKPCTLAQVSDVPGTPGQTDNVVHNGGNYKDPNTGANVPTRYNKPGGLPPPNDISYTTNGKLFNLGALPSNNVYSVQNGQLLLRQINAAAAPIYDSIVQLQAQYGKDTVGNDGIVDVFDAVAPATAADWAQVLAVRIAIVARASQREKDPVSPPTIKLWADSAAAPTTIGPVWTLAADERNYRYKVFQTIVPIRNMIWRP